MLREERSTAAYTAKNILSYISFSVVPNAKSHISDSKTLPFWRHLLVPHNPMLLKTHFGYYCTTLIQLIKCLSHLHYTLSCDNLTALITLCYDRSSSTWPLESLSTPYRDVRSKIFLSSDLGRRKPWEWAVDRWCSSSTPGTGWLCELMPAPDSILSQAKRSKNDSDKDWDLWGRFHASLKYMLGDLISFSRKLCIERI